MSFIVDATYRAGVFQLDNPLPLNENERVQITVQTEDSVAERRYGLINWTGDPEVLRRIAEDDEELLP